MSNSKEELARQYESLSNRRLEQIVQAGTYSSAAVEAAIEELRSRGVQVESADATSEPAETGERVGGQSQESDVGTDLVTVYRTDNPFTANVVRGLLDAEGIFACVWGQNLGVAHIFWSMASGGMRVQVREDQLAQAAEIVAKFERGEYKLEESE